MNDAVLLRERHGSVLMLTFNRPAKLNAFDTALTDALLDALDDVAGDRTVRVILLRGAGRSFSVGQDLEAFTAMQTRADSGGIADHLRRGYNAITARLRDIEKPFIALLGGVTAGFGLSLALASDLRIAADDAQLTLGFSKLGLIPDGGGSLFLPLLCGLGRALEVAWTSERIDAREAHRIGLLNHVVPAAELESSAMMLAARLAEASPVALALTKRAFNRALLPHLARWLDEEATLQEEAAAAPDLREGMQAFFEKRKPVFAPR
ncbi:MAG: enoyl-CoA hydratase [Candidatus Eremiobacteraeota bacterium]|nr:enoyl-CoA hydratase [Candidatus Eremiobacteraeota bacterium]